MSARINYLYFLELSCIFVLSFVVVVLGPPPAPGRGRQNPNNGDQFSEFGASYSSPSSRFSALQVSTMDATTSFYITDTITEEDDSNGGGGSKKGGSMFVLATGLGLTLLLVFLLLIALSLVMYQRHVERKEAKRKKEDEESTRPPPVPKRPDDHDVDNNFNDPLHSPRRGSSYASDASYNYVRPEPVRIAAAQQRVEMGPQSKASRRRDGEEYYSVVQDSGPKFTHLESERRKSDPENNYYIDVIGNKSVRGGSRRASFGGRRGSSMKSKSSENPYYMQVEEGGVQDGGEADYVISAIDGDHHSQLKSPKRQDSDNEYYSRVHTLNKTEDPSNSIDDESNEYSLPPDVGVEQQPKLTTQESQKYSNFQAIRKYKNKNANNKAAHKDDDIANSSDSNNKKKKSIIYMNLRKFKR